MSEEIHRFPTIHIDVLNAPNCFSQPHGRLQHKSAFCRKQFVVIGLFNMSWSVLNCGKSQTRTRTRTMKDPFLGTLWGSGSATAYVAEEQELCFRHVSIFNYYCCIISNISVRSLHVFCFFEKLLRMFYALFTVKLHISRTDVQKALTPIQRVKVLVVSETISLTGTLGTQNGASWRLCVTLEHYL